MKKTKKQSLMFIIVLVLMCLGIGYAYLTTTLSINGITDIDSNTWNIYWDNVQVTTGSVTGEQVTTAPTIDSNLTNVSFHIRLKEPGEFYEFTVDAKNDGTIPAMINGINKTVNNSTTVPNYLNYSISYNDDFPLKNEQLLTPNQKETYKVRIEYRSDINSNILPSTDQSLSLSFGINYCQSSKNVQSTRVYYYGENNGGADPIIGSSYPQTATIYNSPQSNDYDFFMTILKDGIIDEVYAAEKINNKYYYIRVGGATYNESTSSFNQDSIYYQDNINIMNEYFGEENCGIGYMGEVEHYRCSYMHRTMLASSNGFVTTGYCGGGLSFGCGG